MEEKSILVVEDERAIREMVVFTLKRAGFRLKEAEDAASARRAIVDHRPDLILLDWMLPDLSGLELARALRRDEATRELPILMLTARASEDDKVLGLESGADDYLTKPFSARELVARIHALLRRVAGVEGEALAAGDLKLDPASHRVSAQGEEVTLGPTEYRLLKFFMFQPDRVFSRTQVLDRVWGGNVYIEERTVDVHIRRLRKALAPHGCDAYIQTVRGSGYRFSPQAATDR
ncbi:MAG TPA: phosphate regulon transcriptional regulator PhoB [Gammaproteobacteria bacterium]|nr:phosphate regulon transcriptional regulator PhoB [Gammaproteobacteria bacterium]